MELKGTVGLAGLTARGPLLVPTNFHKSQSGPRNQQGKGCGEFARACFRVQRRFKASLSKQSRQTGAARPSRHGPGGAPGGIACFAIPPGGFPPLSTRESGSQATGRVNLQNNRTPCKAGASLPRKQNGQHLTGLPIIPIGWSNLIPPRACPRRQAPPLRSPPG